MPQISAGSDVKFHELNPLFAGYDRCSPGHSFGPTVREYYLIHYIFEGRGTYWTEGKEYVLSAGECFLIKPGQVTRYQADMEDPWYYVWIGFEGSLAEEFEQLPPVPIRGLLLPGQGLQPVADRFRLPRREIAQPSVPVQEQPLGRPVLQPRLDGWGVEAHGGGQPVPEVLLPPLQKGQPVENRLFHGDPSFYWKSSRMAA